MSLEKRLDPGDGENHVEEDVGDHKGPSDEVEGHTGGECGDWNVYSGEKVHDDAVDGSGEEGAAGQIG